MTQKYAGHAPVSSWLDKKEPTIAHSTLRRLPLLLLLAILAASGSSPLPPIDEHGQTPAKAYLISEVAPTDANAYSQYLAEVLPIMQDYGGQPIVFGGRNEVAEGGPIQGRLAVVEFPDYDRLQSFWNSPEYQAVKTLRTEHAASRIILTEGFTR